MIRTSSTLPSVCSDIPLRARLNRPTLTNRALTRGRGYPTAVYKISIFRILLLSSPRLVFALAHKPLQPRLQDLVVVMRVLCRILATPSRGHRGSLLARGRRMPKRTQRIQRLQRPTSERGRRSRPRAALSMIHTENQVVVGKYLSRSLALSLSRSRVRAPPPPPLSFSRLHLTVLIYADVHSPILNARALHQRQSWRIFWSIVLVGGLFSVVSRTLILLSPYLDICLPLVWRRWAFLLATHHLKNN